MRLIDGPIALGNVGMQGWMGQCFFYRVRLCLMMRRFFEGTGSGVALVLASGANPGTGKDGRRGTWVRVLVFGSFFCV